LSEREIKLKSAQSTIRTLNEQLDCMMTKEKASIKKGDAKEVALREQVRKFEEKLRLADVEIAKANEEKNSGIKSV
jgi:predicted  nucleic acid-binding Zn-ribbon protein